MKHWDQMTHEERQERLGDQSIDRSADRAAYEDEVVRLYQAGYPLSLDSKRRARRILKERG